mgnify:CR=1 FL=1
MAKARAQMDVVRTDVQSLRAEYRATLLEAASARGAHRVPGAAARAAGTAEGERHEPRRRSTTRRATTCEEARSRLQNIHESTNRVLASLARRPAAARRTASAFRRGHGCVRRGERSIWREPWSKAPTAGVVSNMKLQVGEHVEKGARQSSA